MMEETGLLSDRTIAIPEPVVFEKVGEETVLLNLDTGFYYGLNPVGSHFWELLVATKNPASVLASMREEYEVEGEVLERDLANLIRELAEKKLIEIE
ncbi:PqqD family protein [Methyloparacoccus murrellii]